MSYLKNKRMIGFNHSKIIWGSVVPAWSVVLESGLIPTDPGDKISLMTTLPLDNSRQWYRPLVLVTVIYFIAEFLAISPVSRQSRGSYGFSENVKFLLSYQHTHLTLSSKKLKPFALFLNLGFSLFFSIWMC